MARVSWVLAAALFCVNALAQTFPSKPVRIVVGYPPGGSGDFLTRLIADELGKELGVSVIAENKPGAGGNLAAVEVAKAAPDGYTLLNAPELFCNRALYKNPGYDLKDFTTITKIATGATVLVVNNNQPFQTARELLDFARANPGKLFMASAGYCSAPHLAASFLEAAANVKFTQVQFKGGGPAAQSLLAGDTNVMFATSPTVMGFIRGNRMRPLAISMRNASPAIPNIPGADEAGIPGFQYTFWFGLYAPAGTPRAVIQRLHAAGVKALSKPEVREKIAIQGMDPTPSATPEAMDAEHKAEGAMIEKLIRASGVRLD